MGAVDVDNVVPGTISYVPSCLATFGSVSGQFELHDLDAGTTTYVEPSGIPLDPHELRYLSNGDYLMISDPIMPGVDLTGLGSFGANEDMIGCDIQEVDPTGAVVWQWVATDHFDPVQDTTEPETWAVGGVERGRRVPVQLHRRRLGRRSARVGAQHGLGLPRLQDHRDRSLEDGRGDLHEGQRTVHRGHGRSDDLVLPAARRPLPPERRHLDVRRPDRQLGPARAVIYSYDLAAGTATMVWQYQGHDRRAGDGELPHHGRRFSRHRLGVGDPPPSPSPSWTRTATTSSTSTSLTARQSYRAIKIPTSAFDIDLLRVTAGTD